MNAALGALAWARPVKKRMNGMLPPITPTARTAGHWRRSMRRTSPAAPEATTSPSRRAAATAFFRVVNTAASGRALTAEALT